MHEISVVGLAVEVDRKDIKYLHMSVYPPEGRVHVAAPLMVDDDAIRLAVISKLTWINRKKNQFQSQERQSIREYVSRESHYFKGQRYLLNVIEQEGSCRVVLRNNGTIDMYVPKETDASKRERALFAWYRKELKAQIPPLIHKWEEIVGVKVASWGVKRMKTKWGSCNVKESRIWLNLELAKKTDRCIEYTIAHEIVHLKERKHNDRFTELMDRYMPQWRLYRDELNQAPLSHEDWDY